MGPWSTEFVLPVDVGFVGFRSGRELERAVREITITPLAVVDASRRPRVPQVLGAAHYGDALVLVHDDWTAPEPEGFWILGRRPTLITLAPASGAAPAFSVQLRTDHVPNHVVLRAPGWTRELDLKPGEPQPIELPPASRGVVSLTVEASGGFVPAEVNPASRDRRLLGVWVEIR
jgi:hypothetical protein